MPSFTRFCIYVRIDPFDQLSTSDFSSVIKETEHFLSYILFTDLLKINVDLFIQISKSNFNF